MNKSLLNMLSRFFILLILIFSTLAIPLNNSLALAIPLNNSLAKPKKKTSSKKKKKKKKKKTKGKVNKKNKPKKKGASQKESKEEQKFRKLKDKMNPKTFKTILQFWNEYHLVHKERPKAPQKIDNDKIKRLKSQLEDLKKQESDNKSRESILEQKIQSKRKAIEDLKNKKPKSRRERKKIAKEIKKLELEISELSSELSDIKSKSGQFGADVKKTEKLLEDELTKQQKISEAELLLTEPIDTYGLTKEQKEVVNSIKTKIQTIIKGYETTGELDRDKYYELIELIRQLTELLKEYSKGGNQTLDYRERIKTLNNLIKDLENSYNIQGALGKKKLAETISILKADVATWKNIDTDNIKQIIHKGLVFKVQIGAYRKRNLAKINEIASEEGDLLEQEDQKGIHQYCLRTFRNYWKADEFKKQMRAIMGFDGPQKSKLKGAPYIVPYIDGKRVPLKQVLEKVEEQHKEISK